jgi:hypothetical protein
VIEAFQLGNSLLVCRCYSLPCSILQELHLLLDYRLDESYTPSRISVQAGTSPHDLRVSEHLRVEWTIADMNVLGGREASFIP